MPTRIRIVGATAGLAVALAAAFALSASPHSGEIDAWIAANQAMADRELALFERQHKPFA